MGAGRLICEVRCCGEILFEKKGLEYLNSVIIIREMRFISFLKEIDVVVIICSDAAHTKGTPRLRLLNKLVLTQTQQ